MYEIVGIIGTIFVLISFLMRDIKWIRLINTIGAILFVVYGGLIKAYSTLVLNIILVGINVYYLVSYKIKERKN